MQRWGGCRLAEELQGCRMAAGMPSGCRDGVPAEMGRVAGMQGGCRAAEELQGWGWLQGCNCYSCGDGVIAEVGKVVGMQGGCRDAEHLH